MNIRFADRKDLPQILSLYLYLNPEEEPLSLKEAEALWDIIEANPICHYLIMEEEGKAVATCNVTIVPNLTRQGRPFALVENVVTHGDYQRRGLGRKLMEAVIEYAREQNCHKVTLLSAMKRTEAHSFYESLGFRGDTKKGFDLRLNN